MSADHIDRDEEIARLCTELEKMRSRIAEREEILVTLNGPDWADMFAADEDWS